MTNAPVLLTRENTDVVAIHVFSDLQLDKILSEQAISILQQPCTAREITRRQQIFKSLEMADNRVMLESALAALQSAERAFQLLNTASNALEKYYRYADLLLLYANCCEQLASLSALGDAFAEVATYFSSEKSLDTIDQARLFSQKMRDLLDKMHVGLLSFADKNWLTPDRCAVSEFELISNCAQGLGFSTPEKKRMDVRMPSSLSDAICSLYPDEISRLAADIDQFSDVDFYIPIKYISDIKFILEIHALIQKANSSGIPHCLPNIADRPCYIANELYDISLLAKGCENIVPNGTSFTSAEPFFFLTGANSGGKTTHLRAVGINLLLFLAGCPIFAKNAQIYPFDALFSHFPKDERFEGVGRLQEEHSRADEMLASVGEKTAFFLFNETFSGTDGTRGFDLLKAVADKSRGIGAFGLYVTHFHEVMSLDYPVLSVEVDHSNENSRTFRIIKAKGGTSSYAADILKKYRLDKDSLEMRRNGYGK